MPLATTGAPLNIANGIREFARATPDGVAVIDGDRQLTYRELADRAARCANALLALGLKTGDRVGVCLGNRLEHPEVAAGVAMAGLVMVPLNPRYNPAEARFIIEHSESRAVIADETTAEVVGEAVREHGIPTLVLGGTSEFREYEAALAAASNVDPAVEVPEESPFCVAYTSGTTAMPKGVMISHRSRVLTFYMAAMEWKLGAGRISVAVAPMYHGAGFAFGYAPVFTGGTVVMLRKWDPEALLRLIAKERAQSVFLVPTHAQMLRNLGEKKIGAWDLSSLDTLYFNAAALPWELKQWVIETFPGVGVHELYGSTESGIITNLRPVDMLRKPGSVGQPWYMTEVRVVDDDGNVVGPGGTGELFSRSPYLMRGYLKNPEATAACTTEDGFVTCGDIVHLDEEGYIYIVGRKSDMIVSGGVNIYPREIEDTLAAHPSVSEAAVIGTPSEQWGEEVTAYVVLAAGAEFNPAVLEAHCRQSLAGYKIPRQWRRIDSLPRNAAGKVVKRDLPRLTP